MNDQVLLVDDHILLRLLLDDEPADLRPRGGPLFTTGLWYHRLCRAMGDRSVAGTFSRSLGSADATVAAAAIEALTRLPEPIGCLSLRELAWPMARLLDDGVRLNLMSLEALAAAENLGAEICLSPEDENPPLVAAARSREAPLRFVR